MLAKKNVMKGFTLVEVIVVLVILAILAAIAIPALTGYIDKAQQKTIIAEAREAKMAITTLMVEQKAEYGDAITTALNGSTYNNAEDYVVVRLNSPGYKVYPCNLVSTGADEDALGYKEYTKLCDVPAAFYQPVLGYWNTGPCGVLDSSGNMVGFRSFSFRGDTLYAVTWGVNLYDVSGVWHEELDGSGWQLYKINLTTDAVTRL
jgi:prepilin-type N-terminal cleavage/methylation domain-containing protein